MRLSLIIPCLLLLSTVGCSAPEGQNAVMYLSSVTVQERRIETDARAIDEILVQSQNGNIDSQALLKAIKKAKETAKIGQEEIAKLNVPDSTKNIHELYKKVFDLNVQQLSLAEQLLTSPQDEKKAEKQQQLAELKKQIEEVEQQILDEKRRLSSQYQEVQLPEASPIADSAADSQSHK